MTWVNSIEDDDSESEERSNKSQSDWRIVGGVMSGVNDSLASDSSEIEKLFHMSEYCVFVSLDH